MSVGRAISKLINAEDTTLLFDNMAACAICQEDAEDETCALNCPANHEFHLKCLTNWCAARPNSACTCPTCRLKIDAITCAGSTYSLAVGGVNAAPSREKQLRQAALDGNLERVTELLSTPGIHVNLATWMGYTSLIKAVRRGNLEIVRELLQGYLAEGNDDAAGEHHGDTAMIWAAGDNHDMVRALMALRGINVNTISAVGWANVTIGFS
jgi:hypothetical protein